MKKRVSLILVFVLLFTMVACGKSESVNADSNITSTTESTTENTTTENPTESTTETTTQTTEKQTETTTKKPITTTEKQETTTKKPTSTTKPETTTKKPTLKPETTTKAGEKITENAADLSQGELLDVWRENLIDGEPVNSEEEYYYYINTYAPNYKCIYCGEHSCPSISYTKNRLSDTVLGYIDTSKCPAIKAEKIKCKTCNKILVSPKDSRWYTDAEHYCDGNCGLNFG